MILYLFLIDLERFWSSGVVAMGRGVFITISGVAIAIIESLISFASFFRIMFQWPRTSICVVFQIHFGIHLWPTQPDCDSVAESEESEHHY